MGVQSVEDAGWRGEGEAKEPESGDVAGIQRASVSTSGPDLQRRCPAVKVHYAGLASGEGS